MQDNINDIIGQKAFDQVEKLDAKMAALEDRFTKTAQAAVSMAASLGDFSKIKDLTDQVNKLQTNLSSLTKQQQDYTLGAAQLKLAKSRTAAALKEEAILVSENSSAYEKLDVRQKQAERSAKQIGLTIGMNSAEYKKASTEANNLLNQLKAMDATLGNARRNVGNYGQAVFSLSQVFREMPSFAYSASQGVLALSNNLPILVDNFNMVRQSAGSTMAALKIFGASIFSFTNIFTMAISVLTIWMARTEMAKNKTKEAKEAVDEYASSVAKETTLLRTLKVAIEDTSQPMDKRISAIGLLQETWPAYFKGLSQEALLTGQVADAYDQAAFAIMRKAKANVLMKEVEKLIEKQLQAEKDLANFYKNAPKPDLNPSTSEIVNTALAFQMRTIGNYKKIISDSAEEINQLLQQIVNLTDKFESKTSKGTKSAASKPEKDKSTRDKTKSLTGLKNEVFKARDEMARKLEVEPIVFYFTWTLEEEIEAFAEKAVPIIEQIQRNVNDMTGAVSSIFEMQLSKEMTALDMRERSLNDYYNNELRFIEQTGLSSAKKEKMKQKLEAETDAKRKQIERDRITAQRKFAIAEKATTIAQIAITTSLAVMRALAEAGLPFPLKVVNAVSAGLLGAAQLAKAIGTPLPQYAKGRKGGKAEMAVVGEQGTELIRHADGSLHVTPNKPTVTFLPEGADVIPNHELLKQAAYVKLQGVNNITPDKYGAALLAAFEDNTAEVRELKNIMASKDYSLKVKTLQGYNDYIKSKLR